MTARRVRRTVPVLVVSASMLTLAGCGTGSELASETSTPQPGGAASTSAPPWPAPVEGVAALVDEAGLDLGPMGMAEHYHPTLRIVIDGRQVPVAANIGVDTSTGAMSAVHTHEGDGTIHVEAATVGEVFTLGQLFTQWDVALDAARIGDVTTDRGMSVTVNGRSVPGDPRDVRLSPDQEILLEVS